MTLNYWLLAFRGFTGIAVSDGALPIFARHLPQMQGLS